MDEFQIVEETARRQVTKYYGRYRAFVAAVEDPENRGRIKLTVPSILGDEVSQWALPAFAYGGGSNFGVVAVPPVGAQVLAEFIEGDLSSPLWTGTFWRLADEVPAEHTGQATKLMKTETGHFLVFDDTDGSEKITLHSAADATMEMNSDGSVQLTGADGATVNIDAASGQINVEDANGNSITLSSSGIACVDAAGNEITTSASGVEVKGITIIIEGQSVTVGGAGGEPVIKGQSFMALFNAHVHNCTAPGAPSGPPVTPLTPAMMTIKTTAA